MGILKGVGQLLKMTTHACLTLTLFQCFQSYQKSELHCISSNLNIVTKISLYLSK